ncbi:unnamed protein product [Cyclocybe aegerita]|uniref:Uncharacterized protein n=1 Tax=Cyclocybe aegerita TaxID=1973307 RepID=A0A8S0WB23_CYCAE|nr:unnamed protein product [Cyclocybe aegerita]
MLFFPHNCSATATCPSQLHDHLLALLTLCLSPLPTAFKDTERHRTSVFSIVRTSSVSRLPAHLAPPASCLPPPPSPPLAPPTPSGEVQMMAVVKDEGAQQI